MYKLIVNNKGVTIIDKTLSKDECESIAQQKNGTRKRKYITE